MNIQEEYSKKTKEVSYSMSYKKTLLSQISEIQQFVINARKASPLLRAC